MVHTSPRHVRKYRTQNHLMSSESALKHTQWKWRWDFHFRQDLWSSGAGWSHISELLSQFASEKPNFQSSQHVYRKCRISKYRSLVEIYVCVLGVKELAAPKQRVPDALPIPLCSELFMYSPSSFKGHPLQASLYFPWTQQKCVQGQGKILMRQGSDGKSCIEYLFLVYPCWLF